MCFPGDERLGHEKRGQNTQVHLSVCFRRVRRIPQVEVTVENGGIGVSKYPSVAFLPFSVSPVGEQQVMASLVIVPKGCVFCCTVTTQAEAVRMDGRVATPRPLHCGLGGLLIETIGKLSCGDLQQPLWWDVLNLGTCELWSPACQLCILMLC